MPLAPKFLVEYGKADILISESAIGDLGRGDHSRLGRLG